MKTHRLLTVPSHKLLAPMRRKQHWIAAVAALALMGAQRTEAATATWTGATDTNFNNVANYSFSPSGSSLTGNLVLFGTNAATVPRQPTTFSTISIGQLGFQGAGWTIGTATGAGVGTLTLAGNPIAVPGVGTGNYVLASSGAGINEIAPNVAITGGNGSPVFVDSGNTLKLDGTLTAAGAFNLSGTGTMTVAGVFTNAGTFTSNTGATLSTGGFAGSASSVTVGSFSSAGNNPGPTSTFNVTAGTFATTGITYIGTGSLNIGSAVTTFSSGALNIFSGGTLSLANSAANDIGTATLTGVTSGGKLVFDNSVNNVARINTPSATNTITLNGGELSLIGNTAATTAQSAHLTFNGTAADTITLTPSTGNLTSLTNVNATNNLTSTASVGGTLLIRGTNLGLAAGQAAGESQFFLTTAPTLVGTAGTQLVPYAIGDTAGATGQGNTFLTYNATTGFTPVASTNTTFSASTTSTNLLQTGADSSAGQTINSLMVSGSGVTTTLTGTLALASGDYLATSGSTGNTLTGGTLAGGNASGSSRLYMFVQDGAAANDLTVNSTLQTANGLTKSGAGTLLLNTPVSNTGNIDIAQGTLKLGGANVLGTNNSGNALFVASGATFDLNGYNLTAATSTIGRANNQSFAAGQITNSSATQSIITVTGVATTAEIFSGNLGITVNSGTLFFQASVTFPNFQQSGIPLINTYTGNTTLSGGTLIAADSQLGAFSNQLIFNGGTLEDGNQVISAARNIVVNAGTTSSAIQIDGNSGGLQFLGPITSPGAGSGLTLQSGSGTANLANNIGFDATGINALADNIDIKLSSTGTVPLNVNFVGNETLGSLASGGGTNTTIGVANNASAATGTLTVGGTNATTTYAGVIRNASLTVFGLSQGITALTKTGTGAMTLSGANSYTGGTTINNGSVILTGSSAAASSQTLATTNASNVINTTNTTGLAFGQPITGAGIPIGAYITSITSGTSFTINANATATSAGTALTFSAYSGLGTGAVTINGGTLSLGTANALQNNTSLLTVSGGTLVSTVAGTTLGGAVTMTSGGISPNGASVGMLTLSSGKNYTMSGGTLSLTLGSSFDQIASAGGTASFNITGGTFALDTTGAGFSYANTYNVLSGFTGTDTVSGLAFTGYDTANYTASLDTMGNLSFSTAVPEPSTWVAGVGLCAILAGGAFRRRNRRA